MPTRTERGTPSDPSSQRRGFGVHRDRRSAPRPNTVRRAVPRDSEPIRVVLVEDNRLACDQLATLLNRQPTLHVVAATTCPTAGLTQVQGAMPQVALVDAGLGNGASQEFVMRAKQAAPQARMVMMDVLPDEANIVGLIKAGANGFILKDATMDAVVGTIEAVAAGTDVLPPTLTPVLWSYLRNKALPLAPSRTSEGVTRLTKREREIADLIAAGLTNKEISRRLNVATHTVKAHVHNILEKFGLSSRLELVVHAHRAGIAAPSRPVG